MYKGCINMLKKRNKKGFTLVELLAVIVILAVVILIAVTAVIPRMNNAKKKALVDEALMYLKAAKESIVFDADQSPSCINVSNLNEKYIKKSSDSYTGVVKNEYINGELSQTINLTNGSLYIVGTDNLTSTDVKSNMPKGFATSCADYNPILAENADTNNIAYKLLMSEGGSTLDANLNVISQRTATVDFNNVETNASKSGLYKAEDDDGASFYYRGVVNNNWLEFGGFYWRIIRINGDGSIRMIYSGLKSSSHTGDEATIKNTSNTYASAFKIYDYFYVQTDDVSGLTNDKVQTQYYNGRFSHAYGGYMFYPDFTLMTYDSSTPSNSRKLNYFSAYGNITSTKNDYYFFKNFDLNTNCKATDPLTGEGACTLVCRSLGDDCIASNYYTLATTEGNYSTTAPGVYTGTSSSNPNRYIFTSPYKYTCWGNSTPVLKNNSDGTTSVYISCPLVSEIIGTMENKQNQAVVRYHGLFSRDINSATTNAVDSDIKKQVDIWYQNNIYSKKDNGNINYLEEYITDGIFCNDRTSLTNNYPFNTSGGAYAFGSYSRNYVSKEPSLKCPNIKRDGFTLSSLSENIVSSSNKGNMALKYPVGLITMDEIAFAGGKYNVNNESYYLYTGKTYLTMTPLYLSSGNTYTYVAGVYDSGQISNSIITSNYGVRPVINLKSSVLYDSGSGTEADPYKVKLAS